MVAAYDVLTAPTPCFVQTPLFFYTSGYNDRYVDKYFQSNYDDITNVSPVRKRSCPSRMCLSGLQVAGCSFTRARMLIFVPCLCLGASADYDQLVRDSAGSLCVRPGNQRGDRGYGYGADSCQPHGTFAPPSLRLVYLSTAASLC